MFKKYFIGFLMLIASASLWAATNTVTCPMMLTCNYQAGTCDTPQGAIKWTLDSSGAQEPFSGSIVMSISKIWADKQGSGAQTAYQFECTYNYGVHSAMSIYTYAYPLTGANWQYSGFGNQNAICSSPTQPNTCTGQQSS